MCVRVLGRGGEGGGHACALRAGGTVRFRGRGVYKTKWNAVASVLESLKSG